MLCVVLPTICPPSRFTSNVSNTRKRSHLFRNPRTSNREAGPADPPLAVPRTLIGLQEERPTMPSKSITPKQPKAKALRAKRKREPQVHENAKTAMVIKGRKTSQDITDALKDIVSDSSIASAFPDYYHSVPPVPPAALC